ncbi:MAG: hypothetical protein H0U16_12190 [Actinobacteria bacterium]|nr:hypothetical protein [Actinomycetota bacterium]
MIDRLNERARLGRLALSTGLIGALLLIAAGPAAAAYSDTADPGTWGTNGRVRAIARSTDGTRIYLGGDFTAVKIPGGSQTRPANHIVALDAVTGAEDPTFDASLDGNVYALEYANGIVYAGGFFTNANGAPHNKIVALDGATGATEASFDITANFPVRALELSGDNLYMGGSFTKVFKGATAKSRTRLAAINLPAATVDTTWQPKANKDVRALQLSRDGFHMYAGGDFTTITNGATVNSQFALASISTTTGVFDDSFRPTVDANPAFCGNGCVMDLATDGTRVYAGVGGKEPGNMLLAVEAATGADVWRRVGDGDFQAVDVQGDWVYGGGHFTSIGGNPAYVKFVTVDAATGDFRTDQFKPTVNSSLGVWDILAEPEEFRAPGSKLYIGGDFTKVSTQNKFRFASFTDDGQP